nr:MAG TPA: hypothetical protein [Caudoviricetes sp.]
MNVFERGLNVFKRYCECYFCVFDKIPLNPPLNL